jgi:ATP-dependent Clp protease ATP-binding subunit ClpC
MLERFTDAARHAIGAAGDLARETGSDDVAPVHLLAALSADEGSTGRAVEAIGLTPEHVRRELERLAGDSDRSGARHMGFTPAASLVIEGSLRISRDRGAARIDTQDLLLALLRRPDGAVTTVLEACDTDPDAIRRALSSFEG